MKNFIPSVFLILYMISFSETAITLAGNDLLFEKSLATQEGKLLEADIFAGSIKVSTTTQSEVTVKAYGRKDELDMINIYAENTSDGVTVGAKPKSGHRMDKINLRFEISVPETYNLSLKTGGGSISVTSIKGKSEVETAGGSISFVNNSGETRATTMGGSISISNFTGNVSAETNGGNIKLVGSDGFVTASTLGGNIMLDYTGKNQGIELNTNAGNITAVLPSGLDAEADLSTTCGKINCDFGKVTDKHIGASFKYTIGNGGSKLVCSTMAGSITVNKK